MEQKRSTIVIAEAGSCHEGNFDLALELLDIAVSADAEVLKMQYVSDPTALAARRGAKNFLDSYCKLAYPVEWHARLRKLAHKKGISYGCTVFLPQDVAAVAPHVDYLKVSSFEAEDHELIRTAVAAHKRVIVSTGMLNWPPTDTSADTMIVATETDVRYPWAFLHCVSAYPAPMSDLNLAVLHSAGYPSEEGPRRGFSDHSRDTRVGAWAVIAGAQIVEAHIRLNSTSPQNLDYGTALAPDEFKQYVQNIRDAEAALGDGEKRIMPSEAGMAVYKSRRTS